MNYDLVMDYSTLFENDNENNIESVFEVQYTDIEGAGFGCLQCSEGNVAVGFNGPRTFNGPLFESGFSFNVPTQESYDLFEEDDTRKDVAILNMEQFIIDNSDFNNGAGVTFVEGFNHTGFFNRKYIPRVGDANTGDQNLTNPNNYRAIRFADVLLMAAEASVQSGGSSAISYLNQVRSRAFGDNSHNYPYNGESDLIAAIANERRLELAGEGHRFFDLVRTGAAKIAFDSYNATRPNQTSETEINFTVNKNEVFPIPLVELQLANAVSTWGQNQGY